MRLGAIQTHIYSLYFLFRLVLTCLNMSSCGLAKTNDMIHATTIMRQRRDWDAAGRLLIGRQIARYRSKLIAVSRNVVLANVTICQYISRSTSVKCMLNHCLEWDK